MVSSHTATMAAPDQPGVDALHRRLGLTDEEHEAVVARLGRDPNHLELAIFSVMWSEHCSYKSSKPVLGLLPTGGDGVLAGPGENAGVVSIGDGLAVAFKLESHNHPSAVEPYQGAATGVGGILRDIVAMGARPIAVLDALRFGDPERPATWRSVDGVVRGVGDYGNCVGIPTVGGELVFHAAYDANPLVNVMAVGLQRVDSLTRAEARGPGNFLVLYGATTGRDGIGGASVLASASFGADEASKRPSVQIGDPFVEKLILEVTLELIDRGLVVGVQDLGAGGIACAVSEMADRAGTGIVVDLDAVPRREAGMAPWEVMISESQERMCAVVRPSDLHDVRAVCQRWGLPSASVIGRVTDDGSITIVLGGLEGDGTPAAGATIAGRIPAAALTSHAIVHRRQGQPPEGRWGSGTAHFGSETARVRAAVADATGSPLADSETVLRALLGRPGLASVGWVVSQYDSTVGGDTVEGPGRGAAVIRVTGTSKGLAMSVDGNATASSLDPRLGAALSVAQAARNVAVTGARPLGVTDCLNFGDPTRPEVFWAFEEAVRGIADACRAMALPVVGGNVSFYNESPSGPILPTPQIGVVGLLDDVSRRIRPAFAADGDTVAVIGGGDTGLAGSAFAEWAGSAPDDRLPRLDLASEVALHRFLVAAANARLLTAAQDVGVGGLGVALAKMALWGERGARLVLGGESRPILLDLFGEGPSRLIVTHRSTDEGAVVALAAEHRLPMVRLGVTGGDRLFVAVDDLAESAGRSVQRESVLDVHLSVLRQAWASVLPPPLATGV
jgi:phosphoribosylformylglycinamidine synthase